MIDSLTDATGSICSSSLARIWLARDCCWTGCNCTPPIVRCRCRCEPIHRWFIPLRIKSITSESVAVHRWPHHTSCIIYGLSLPVCWPVQHLHALFPSTSLLPVHSIGVALACTLLPCFNCFKPIARSVYSVFGHQSIRALPPIDVICVNVDNLHSVYFKFAPLRW